MSAIWFRNGTILHGEDGKDWCSYLWRKFQKPDFEFLIHTINVDSLSYENPPEIEVSVRESHVLILLITARLLTYMENNSWWFSSMLDQHDRHVTTMLVVTINSVDYDDFQEVCVTKGYNSSLWEFVELQADGSNVHKIVTSILKIVDTNRTKHEQQEEESYKPRICEMYPNTIRMTQERIIVVFFEQTDGHVTLAFEDMSDHVTTTRINPYCVTFTPPVRTQGTYAVHILIDGVEKEVLQLCYCNAEFTSVELMKQYFGVDTVEELDILLADQYRQSICTDEVLNRLTELTKTQQDINRSGVYATAFHWAAANGLKELCCQIMTSPCASNAPNFQGETPDYLAEKGGHKELKDYIYLYFETKQCADTCDYYVQFYNPLESDQAVDSGQVCLGNDSIIYEEVTGHPEKPPVPWRNRAQSVDLINDSIIYEKVPGLQEKPPVPRKNRTKSVPETDQALQNAYSWGLPSLTERLQPGLPSLTERLQPGLPSLTERLQPVKEQLIRDGAVGCRSQNELIDIQDGFRDGLFTIGQVEMLFNAWNDKYQQGNAQSFRHKKMSLQQFRDDHKPTLSALKEARQKKLPPPTKEEHMAPVNISEPITTRRTDIGSRSHRQERKSDQSLRGSDNSVAYRSSNDSGFYHDEVYDPENRDSVQGLSGNRTSLLLQFQTSPSFDQPSCDNPPALPPRKKKPHPIVYTKKKT